MTLAVQSKIKYSDNFLKIEAVTPIENLIEKVETVNPLISPISYVLISVICRVYVNQRNEA